jgi:hypothetical protein
MREFLLIDLAMCAAVIVVTAAAIVMHWRRGKDQPRMPAGERSGALAELIDGWVFGPEVADVPGFSDGPAERRPGAGQSADPDPDPEQEQEQAAEPSADVAAEADLGSRGLGTEPDESRAAVGTVTISERIAGYYEQADAPVARYLAARGWAGEPQKPSRAADADAAPASGEAAAEPGTASRQLAA